MTRGMRFTSSFGLVISLTLTSALPKLSLLLDQEKIVVAAALRTNTGLVLERVISRGSGEPKTFIIETDSKNNGSAQSDKPFAFSYLPLFSANRTFIPDGEHNLILFIYDEQSATPEVYSRVRPTFVPGQLIPGVTLALSKLLIPLKDSFVVRSFLCSTLHTQDEILLRLMKWNTLLDDPDVLRQTLTKLKFASEVEICKFLTNIFDPLFGVLVCWANAETKEYGELVFYALVTLLGWNSLRPSIYQLQACSRSLHRSSLRLYNRLEPPFTIFSNLTK
ncbi:hypothetical protein MJO29_012876 [Puccinia striiformis f. sp. tritici]|nr:hypothetical protein MJO29_012876 [Puccinia striiformis f. sp. tritici]